MKKTKKRKLKKGIFKKILFLLIILLISGYCFYLTTPTYKLKKLGYSNYEVRELSKLNRDFKKEVLNRKYQKNISTLLNNKNYQRKNLDKYYEKLSDNFNVDELIFLVDNNLENITGYNPDNLSNYYNYYINDPNDIKLIIELVNEGITYKKIISDIKKDPYYIKDNLKRYILFTKHNNDSARLIVEAVNANTDTKFYTNIKESDTSKNNLILVNKYYALDKNYIPNNLVSIEGSFRANKITSDAYNEMKDAASKDGISLQITSAYRSYNQQSSLYNQYKTSNGLIWADSYSARPGHSEHQTGLALDILTPGATLSTFENFKEFTWLKNNAYKYGFILRYPKDKEHITGYNYEPWHYRYVGKKVATTVYENDITWEEYYRFYIDK